MLIFRIACVIALSLFCISDVRADDSYKIATSKLTFGAQALGHTPEWVYEHFGRPALVKRAGCCRFAGYTSNRQYHPTAILVHAYDLEIGGRIAFLYDQPINISQWEVVGFVYDSESANEHDTVKDLLGQRAVGVRLFECFDTDFYHHEENQISSPSVYGTWDMGLGRSLFAKYMVGPDMPTRYDPVSGKDLVELTVSPLRHRG